MIDVGQGDALAVRSPRGRWLLVDAGGGWQGGDAAASIVWPYLRRHGGDVVYLSMSHPHLDHIGGMATLLRVPPPTPSGMARTYPETRCIATYGRHADWGAPGDGLRLATASPSMV